jgi:hypothetical protein
MGIRFKKEPSLVFINISEATAILLSLSIVVVGCRLKTAREQIVMANSNKITTYYWLTNKKM